MIKATQKQDGHSTRNSLSTFINNVVKGKNAPTNCPNWKHLNIILIHYETTIF